MATKDILMDGDKMCIAWFKKKKYTIVTNVFPANGGTVSGAGIYNKGTSVDINAIPATGYQFDHWSGDLSGNVNPTIILMNDNKSITAHFIEIQYTLTTSVEPPDGGTITGAGTYPEGTVVEVEAIPNPDYEFDHWEGDTQIGMCIEDIYDENFDTKIDELLANGFTQIRITISDFNLPDDVDIAKGKVLIAIAKGANATWGIGCSNITLTAANWDSYRNVVLAQAQWAQDNGVYEFVIGNEEERHNDDTTITDAQVRNNIRSLATEVKAIFTNGQVTYGNACLFLTDWINEGMGDLDQIGWMVYGDEDWLNNVDTIISAFGTDRAYINEWNVDSGGYYQVPTRTEADEAIIITEMLGYFKVKGITRTFFFLYSIPFWYQENSFEVRKTDGTYRQLWNSLLSPE